MDRIKIQTPYIDGLAKTGMRVNQIYAGCTVCAPSHCCLVTGLHNGHGRVRDNIPHGIHLRPDNFTVADLLKQAGYRTGGFGHWNQDQAHQDYPDYPLKNARLFAFSSFRKEPQCTRKSSACSTSAAR